MAEGNQNKARPGQGKFRFGIRMVFGRCSLASRAVDGGFPVTSTRSSVSLSPCSCDSGGIANLPDKMEHEGAKEEERVSACK